MHDRRQFMKSAALGALAFSLAPADEGNGAGPVAGGAGPARVVSTWKHGLAANAAAWTLLATGGAALDAVEAAARVTEADPEIRSVGFGGLPDRDGHVTLDACIMDAKGEAGAVAALAGIKHASSVARRVMEATPHVMLVGEGARDFAVEQGFAVEDLLTPDAEASWRRWLAKNAPAPPVDEEQHDTIGILAMDESGDLAGCCTTSGLAYKLPGRVGDSPLIGAGLYVDNAVGVACATGLGEAIIKTTGSFLVVELMRRGAGPEEACREAVDRIVEREGGSPEFQVGYLALARDGRVGACSIRPGFDYASRDAGGERLDPAPSALEK